MIEATPLLILGAGPFGLALAAYAGARGMPYVILGKAMEFWRSNMPDGMYLRSDLDWHLDPDDQATLDRFIEEHCLSPEEISPLPLGRYLEYVDWFMRRKRIEPLGDYMERLDYFPGRSHPFRAVMAGGGSISAAQVAMAPGFKSFKHIPAELAEILPAGSYAHTCDAVNLASYAGLRVLIIGGRQSAFEWAALLHENGARQVHVSYRHETPVFEEADWSWMSAMMDRTVTDPGWYRRLPQAERGELARRFWSEARMKLEPWLWPRVNQPDVHLWPHTQLALCYRLPSGALEVQLDDNSRLDVDRVILATGYKVDMTRLPYLAAGNTLERLQTFNGYPVLDESLQASIPGLYVTSLPAVQDFGSFFAFTVSVRASARLIGAALA